MNKILIASLLFCLVQFHLIADITAIGNVQSSSKSLISTQVAGRVEKVLVDVGTQVKKDQALVQLDKRFYEIDLAQKTAALECAKIELSDTEKNFIRMQKLWEKPQGETPSISLKRFEDAKTKFDQSSAQLKQAEENFNRAKLNLDETTIRSPYNGVITKKLVDIGESIPVQPVTNVVEVQVLHPLYLEFSIPQVYSDHLFLDMPIDFEIDGITSKIHTAKIDLFYPSLDENTRSLRCRAVLDNKDFKIRPGSLATVTIKTEPAPRK